MTMSYNAAWDDTVRLFRSHASLIAAVAGFFIFLPNLLLGHFVPQPEQATATLQAIFAALNDYIALNWHWLFLNVLVNMVGALAILLLIFDERRPTVGGAIVGALILLPFYFVASFLSGLIVLGGLILLIVPGLYLYGRLAPLGPVIVAENRRNPFDAIARSFAVTRGNGWAVLGFVLLIIIASLLVTVAVGAVLGLILLLLLGSGIGGFLVLIVETALEAIMTTLLVVVMAAIYRTLAGADSARTAAD